MTKGKTRNSSGITLIALVLTIIVLLILAGISIAMLSGDNSILQKATDAKIETEKGQEKEIIALAYNSALAKKVSNGDSTAVTADDLNTELTNQGASASGTNPITIIFDVSKRQYNIDSNGAITLNVEKIKITEFSINPTGTQKTIPTIPSGFYYVGGSVNNGYVISDNVNDENKYASSNDVGTELQGNQFVWVPVAQNQKITLKVESEENITNITLYDPFGDVIDLGTINGKTYNNTAITPTINGGYKVEVTTADCTVTRTLIVRSLYAKDTFLDMSYKEKVDEASSIYTDEFFESEEWLNVVNGYYGNPSDKSILYQRMGVTTDAEFVSVSKQRHSPLIELNNTLNNLKNNYAETEDYTTSINDNGGFYVGRYEVTYVDGNATSKPSTDVRQSDAVALTDGMLWNKVSQTDALAKANAYNEKCSLLTGSAWDRTIGWLVQTNNKTLAQVASDSREWGIYSDSIFTHSHIREKTGEYEQTKTNNIYDLAGNLYEWTTEAYSSTNRAIRGGAGGQNGGTMEPASYRFYNSPSAEYGDNGFRLALYL